jgi:serine/threonine-protein kinase
MNNSTAYQLKQGTVLNDKWIILEPIGKGGMGEVYRAHQVNLKRDVAIKILSAEILQSYEEGDTPDVAQRFRREVQAMAQITHPNILQIFDYDCTEWVKDGVNTPVEFIVMEYVPGATLRHTMSEEGFSPDEGLISSWIREYFFPVLDGVQALHDRDLIHRDLKPENVLISGVIPKITDFGLARSSWLKPVTQSVDMHGTVPYMPPEQFVSFKRADRRADIYALGKILYEAVEGKMTKECIPFRQVQLKETPTSFLQGLDPLIRQSTAENPEDRLGTVAEFKSALAAVLGSSTKTGKMIEATTSPPSSRRYKKWTFLSLIATLVLLAGVFIWFQYGKNRDLGHQVGIEAKGPSPSVSISPGKILDSFIAGDGIRMMYIPGGTLEKGKSVSTKLRTIRVNPFYIDEILVTQHHYLDFLNEIKEKLTIEKGIVKWNNQIWLLMGEGENPGGNIFFEHGRFHLREIDQAHLPITRVTWYGAKAYAEHYGKRLPTAEEWEYIFNLPTNPPPSTSSGSKDSVSSGGVQDSTHKSMMPRHGVTESAPKSQAGPSAGKPLVDPVKLKELAQSMTGIIGDWAQSNNEADAYPSVVIEKADKDAPTTKKLRYPWEASAQIGFRTVTEKVQAP